MQNREPILRRKSLVEAVGLNLTNSEEHRFYQRELKEEEETVEALGKHLEKTNQLESPN